MHDVVRSAEHAYEPREADDQPRYFPCFADGRIGRRLTGLDAAAGKQPSIALDVPREQDATAGVSDRHRHRRQLQYLSRSDERANPPDVIGHLRRISRSASMRRPSETPYRDANRTQSIMQ